MAASLFQKVGAEEHGLLAHPHTSAGRVPTDKAVREILRAVRRGKPEVVVTGHGKVLVFLGAPVSEEDADQIHSITFGERVSPALVGLAATFNGEDGFLAQ